MKFLAFYSGLFVLGLAAAAEPVQVSIPSLDGKLQIPGYWFEAKTDALRPAVIGLHGCSGPYDAKGRLAPSWMRDAGYFNSEGMHLLIVDSLTPRGHKSICEIRNSRRTITEEDRRGDVFAAMQWLARQANVDKPRIAVVGRSHGAQTVLSVVDRTDPAVRAQPLQPRAAVALYPGCTKFLKMWDYEPGVPLLLMIGALDDWTPAQRCVALHEKTRRAQNGAKFELVVYPDSYHGFDGTAPVRVRDNVGNTKSGKATVGGNPQARRQAHERMFEFLSAELNAPLQLKHEDRFNGAK